jgi:hypothetical protein
LSWFADVTGFGEGHLPYREEIDPECTILTLSSGKVSTTGLVENIVERSTEKEGVGLKTHVL